ncbi:dihydrofolate reductase [Dichotomocladium elegans]|nr:dihydrofolate reductase [Dichotomocladium elegans]
MEKFALVVAATEELGIGLKSLLPWRIPRDMQFFKDVTTHVAHESKDHKQNCVIMGRVTWESIPSRFRPLPDRINIVISRDGSYAVEGATLVHSLEDALTIASFKNAYRVFVIGGSQIYKLALEHPLCTHILLTRVRSKVECDTFFPEIDERLFRLADHEELEAYVGFPVPRGVQTHKDLQFEFTLYIRRLENVLV